MHCEVLGTVSDMLSLALSLPPPSLLPPSLPPTSLSPASYLSLSLFHYAEVPWITSMAAAAQASVIEALLDLTAPHPQKVKTNRIPPAPAPHTWLSR
jgi:hypothetical protein